jgi:hypothetical protein
MWVSMDRDDPVVADLIKQALHNRNLKRLEADAEGCAAPKDALMHLMLRECAHIAARLDLLESQRESNQLSSQERMRCDPLAFIPKERLTAAQSAAPHDEKMLAMIAAGDPDLLGFGWWRVEHTQVGVLMWSGRGPVATLLLPALGGGNVTFVMRLRSPFGQPLVPARLCIMLDMVPLELKTVENDGVEGTFSATVKLPASPACSYICMMFNTPIFHDNRIGKQRDVRSLGLGFRWCRIEKTVDGAEHPKR